jgi:hypothetical protein
MLLFLILCGFASSAQLPSVTGKFCANAHDFLLSNNSTVQSVKYKLCMDSANFKFRREDVCGISPQCDVPGEKMIAIYNGTHQWVVKPVTKGKYSCVYYPVSPEMNTGPPFEFVILDPATKKNHMAEIDGFQVEDWLSDRSPHTPGHGANEEFMHWYLKTAEGGSQDMVRADCVQTAKPGTITSGNRDFSANYTRDVPDSLFDLDTKINCSGSVPVWTPGTCSPSCTSGTLCCKDPLSSSKSSGACYKVTNCAQIHDMTASWAIF